MIDFRTGLCTVDSVNVTATEHLDVSLVYSKTSHVSFLMWEELFVTQTTGFCVLSSCTQDTASGMHKGL